MSTRDAFEKWCDLTERDPTDRDLYAAWEESRVAALEEAAKECDEMAEAWNRMAQGAADGRYDFKCDAGDECADAIRALAKGENDGT